MEYADHEHLLTALQIPPLATDLDDNVIINSCNSNNQNMLTPQRAAEKGNGNEYTSFNDSNDGTFSQ